MKSIPLTSMSPACRAAAEKALAEATHCTHGIRKGKPCWQCAGLDHENDRVGFFAGASVTAQLNKDRRELCDEITAKHPPKKPAIRIPKPHENPSVRPLQNPVAKRHKAPEIPRPIQREASGTGRTLVRFTGFRVRPLDPDNFAGSVKDLLDGCRHAGLIPGDEPWRIRLETDQVRVATFAEERTEIEIETP